MYFKPRRLGRVELDDEQLKADRQSCLRFGSCGVGSKALYFGTYFFDCRVYIPVSSIQRVYKRVAMSRGGFTGRGVFGSIAYLVVEYDNGRRFQCMLKHEADADAMRAEIELRFPKVKTISQEAARRLAEAEAAERAKIKKNLSPEAKASIAELERARSYLAKRPDLSTRLQSASKAKRAGDRANPFYKWVAVAILCFAAIAASYGVYTWYFEDRDNGLYVTLIGMAMIFLFSGSRVRPTQLMNARLVAEDLAKARKNIEDYIGQYEGTFPLPVYCAHPVVLTRMIRSLRYGRSETIPQSYEDMKKVLKSLNSSVSVSQTEYDEVVAVKPMFLLEQYR